MTLLCPYCDQGYIEGADFCERCGQPLDDQHLPTPSTLVEQSLLKDRVSVLSPKEPIVVAPDASVGDVLNILVDREIGCVFIVDDSKVVGVFSERDALLRLDAESVGQLDRPVSDFMTPSPQKITADSKIAFAVRMMDQGSYRHVPVVDDEDRPTGVISVRDILAYLTDKIASGASS